MSEREREARAAGWAAWAAKAEQPGSVLAVTMEDCVLTFARAYAAVLVGTTREPSEEVVAFLSQEAAREDASAKERTNTANLWRGMTDAQEQQGRKMAEAQTGRRHQKNPATARCEIADKEARIALHHQKRAALFRAALRAIDGVRAVGESPRPKNTVRCADCGWTYRGELAGALLWAHAAGHRGLVEESPPASAVHPRTPDGREWTEGDMHQVGVNVGPEGSKLVMHPAALSPETVERIARATLAELPAGRNTYHNGVVTTVDGDRIVAAVVARLSGREPA